MSAGRAVEVAFVERDPEPLAAAERVLAKSASTPPESVRWRTGAAAEYMPAMKNVIMTSDDAALKAYGSLNFALQRMRAQFTPRITFVIRGRPQV